jgi:cell division protein FtsL
MRMYGDAKPIVFKKPAKLGRKPDKRAARRARASNSSAVMLSVSAIILVAVLISMGYLAQRSALITAYSNMEALEESISGLKQLYNERSMELAELTSIAKVEITAREKLGMVDAKKVAVLLVSLPEKPQEEAPAAASVNRQAITRLNLEVPTVLAVFGSWLRSTAISATSSMISTWHANFNGSLPDVLQ